MCWVCIEGFVMNVFMVWRLCVVGVVWKLFGVGREG